MTDEQSTQPEDEASIDLSKILAAAPDVTLATCRACLAEGAAQPRQLRTTGDGDFPTLAAQHYIAKHALSTDGAIAFPAFTQMMLATEGSAATDDEPAVLAMPAHMEFYVEARTA